MCALHKSPTEILSDFHGIVYVPFDEKKDSWKLELAKEMMAAGFDIDLNNIAQ